MDDFLFLHSSFDKNDSINKNQPFVALIEEDPELDNNIRNSIRSSLDIDVYGFDSTTSFLNYLDRKVRKFILIINSKFGDKINKELIQNLKNDKCTFVEVLIKEQTDTISNDYFLSLKKPLNYNKLLGFIINIVDTKFGIKKEYIIKDKNITDYNKSIYRDKFLGDIVGNTGVMEHVFNNINKAIKHNLPVFIMGSSGTGKKLVAHTIHKMSFGNNKPFIFVNCNTIPKELLYGEIFGRIVECSNKDIHVKEGYLREANNGTFFLVGIEYTSKNIQEKLINCVKNKRLEDNNINVRIIVSTESSSEELLRNNIITEEFYEYINGIKIYIPDLKSRKEDIPLIISKLLSKYFIKGDKDAVKFSNDAVNLLMNYDWPGNVRELENLIERIVILKRGRIIDKSDLPERFLNKGNVNFKELITLTKNGIDLKSTLSSIEDSLIIQALRITSGNKNKASKLLKLNRTTLIEKIKKKSISSSVFIDKSDF